MAENPLLILLGATTSGKTKLAVQVAAQLDGEIISADSRQIFKQMDIGTGKDLNEYLTGKIPIAYHLIDILNPGEIYHVDAFKNDFYNAFQSITDRKKIPILCGGTGMYIHSILQNQIYTSIPVNVSLRGKLQELSKAELADRLSGYERGLTRHVDRSSAKRMIRGIEIAEYLSHNQMPEINRPQFKRVVFGLKNEVEITRKNIAERLDVRLRGGMIEEVERLIRQGINKDTLISYGLEYKFISNFLSDLMSYEDLKLQLFTAICQFAKRQNTFFRKMEKDGVEIIWLNANNPTEVLKNQVVERFNNEIFTGRP